MVVYTLLRAPGITTNLLVSQRRKKRQGRVLQMSKQFVKQFQLRRPFPPCGSLTFLLIVAIELTENQCRSVANHQD